MEDISSAILTSIKVVIIGVAANEIFKKRNPRSVNTRVIKFVLYTRTFLDPEKDTIILVHGFRTNAGGEFPRNVRDAYLETYPSPNDVNIICVDWGKLAGESPAEYPKVLERLASVAERVTDFVYWLENTKGLDLAKVHLIGHSLGAHICGMVGSMQVSERKLGMITGLDPAGLGFGGEKGIRQLQSSDARHVQVLHTSCFLGTQECLGHVDYFVNGGSQQPNCGGWDLLGICAHAEVHRLFAQAIRAGDRPYRLHPRP